MYPLASCLINFRISHHNSPGSYANRKTTKKSGKLNLFFSIDLHSLWVLWFGNWKKIRFSESIVLVYALKCLERERKRKRNRNLCKRLSNLLKRHWLQNTFSKCCVHMFACRLSLPFSQSFHQNQSRIFFLLFFFKKKFIFIYINWDDIVFLSWAHHHLNAYSRLKPNFALRMAQAETFTWVKKKYNN